MCSAVGRQAYFGKTRAAGDMLSLDAVYHRNEKVIKAHVLNELIDHIEEYRDSENHYLWHYL